MAEPSAQSKIIKAFLRFSGKKAQVNRIKETSARGAVPSEPPPGRLHRKHHITAREINGRTVWTIAPKDEAGDLHICYFHGGAYVSGFTAFYWNYIARLVDRLHCTVTAPDYPLAPQYHAEDVFAMIVPLYRELVAAVGASQSDADGRLGGRRAEPGPRPAHA